jgi:outer membrane protein assembly factor BamB
MIMRMMAQPNPAAPESGLRWHWVLLAACGCAQWPSAELDAWLPPSGDPSALAADERPSLDDAPLASVEAAQTQTAEAAGGSLWQVQLDSAALVLSSLSAAPGAVFAAGTVASESATDASDASLSAFSSEDGTELWTRVLGSTAADAASASASGGDRVLIAGRSAGALAGPAQGFGDAFVAAYSHAGELLWTHQLGSPEPDAALAVSVDASGAVLVAGETRGMLAGARTGNDRDAFLAKLGPDGALLYTRQLGSGPGLDEIATGVATDASGDVLLAGYTFGAVSGAGNGSADAFLARYSGAGELLWAAQLGGAGYDAAEAVAVDGMGAAYVTGQIGGSLTRGVVFGGRPFLAKYSPLGEPLWTLELEDAEMGAGSSVVVDGSDQPWIAGRTSASFAAANQGGFDSFVARFSAEGSRLSAVQPGVADSDRAAGLALDGERLLLLSRATQSGDAPFDYALLSAIATQP